MIHNLILIWLCRFGFIRLRVIRFMGVKWNKRIGLLYIGESGYELYIFIVIVIITVSNLQGLGAILLCIRGY